ncbi:MAG: NADP-dependent oxidoreductase [Chitinophagaceae bacterium]
MKAIILKDFGSAENLLHTTLPTPSLRDDEVLVQVNVTGINPIDIKTRNGQGAAAQLKHENPIILGWDISGIVQETGKSVTQFKKGDAVFGMVNFPGHGKAYAEYVAAPAAHLALKPVTISHGEAAATPLAALTAWQAFTHHSTVQPKQKVLVHAASGGVGHFAVQIAKQLGAYVIGTSSAVNKDFVLSLGADEHIDYNAQKFEELIQDADIVLDAFGGEHAVRSLAATKPGGTVISLPSATSAQIAEQAAAVGKRGVHFRVSSNGADMEQLAALLLKGSIHAHVSHLFEWSDMAKAHQQVESGRTVGKVVVAV